MIKNAQFVEGLAQNALKFFSPKEWVKRPFEIIFETIGTQILWKISKPLGIMAYVGNILGSDFSPKGIGKKIDGFIGAGKEKLDVSDNNLKQASESVVDEFLNKAKGLTTTSVDLMNDIIQVKGSLNKNDIIASIYYSNIKTAKEGFFSRLFGNKEKTRITMASSLYGLLKMLLKGILAASVAGGISSMIKSNETITDTKKEKSSEQNYSNVNKNVEDTIITFLNASISNFSKTFEQIYKKPLKGSVEMKKILLEIENLNNSPISNLNNKEAFIGPKLLDIAYKIMPLNVYEKIEKTDTNKDKIKKLKKLLTEV